MKTRRRLIMVLALLVPLSGCALFSQSDGPLDSIDRDLVSMSQGRKEIESEETTDSNQANRIANPPARTIRFDGHEIVLGNGEPTALTPDRLLAQLRPCVEQGRYRSAAIFAQQHSDASERLLAERWASDANDPVLRLVADIMSQRSLRRETDWNSLLLASHQRPEAAQAYQKHRRAFTAVLQTTNPTDEASSQLQQSAQLFNHPLVSIDCLRLLGLREQLSDRTDWAESLYHQATLVAVESGCVVQAAELGLMVAEAMQRREAQQDSATAWSTAVRNHLAAMTDEDVLVDASFWTRAEHIRPGQASYPTEVAGVMGRHVHCVGCSRNGAVEMVLWTAVSQSQFDRGEVQLALLNLKKAETFATGDDLMWLRIAQSKCLSALGQIQTASAILSGPAASADAGIAAAAMAALGSAKLQSGAYQQGAQLLNRALTGSSGLAWASKNQAQADLALAQLIIGDTDVGFEALHVAQKQFERQSDVISLIQSLDNELRLLEHEHRTSEAQSVKNRIAQLERLK